MRNTSCMEYVIQYLKNIEPGKPIYTEDTTKAVAEHFNIKPEEVRKNVNVCLNRTAKVGELTRFMKGIYYKPKKTAFGPSKLNPLQVVIDQYIQRGKSVLGYETGPSIMNKLGLTTQMPKYSFFASNAFNGFGDRKDERLKVVLRKPHIQVNEKNKYYLQLLDVLENKDKTPIDAPDANLRLNKFINAHNLDYRKLLGLAKKYYNKKVIMRIAELATEEEE